VVLPLAFALTAAPASAAECPNTQYRTGASAELQDCRAYELVSPPQKNGVGVRTYPTSVISGATNTPGHVSPDGNAIAFTPGVGPAVDDAERGFGFRQVARRTEAGWINAPALSGASPLAPINGTVSSMRYALTSDDARKTLFGSGTPFTPDIAYSDQTPTSLHAIYLATEGAGTQWLTRPQVAGASPRPGDPANTVSIYAPVGGSKDLSAAFFATRGTLTGADIDAGRAALTSWGLYRVKDGQVSSAGVLPGGGIDAGGAVLAGMALPNGGASTSALSGQMPSQYRYGRSVSDDGDRWAFVSPDPHAATGRPPQLYVGQEAGASKLLSAELGQQQPVPSSSGVRVVGAIRAAQSQSATTNAGAVYAVASNDTRVVVFATSDALVDGVISDPAVVRAYRYDASGPEPTLEHLSDLDRPASQPQGDFGPVLAMSGDGSRILYRNEADQLKLWRQGQPTVLISNGVARVTAAALGGVTDAAFAADGRSFVINSRVALRSNPLHPAGGTSPQNQVYHYDESTDRLTCVSCPQPNQVPAGPASWVLDGIDNGFEVNTTGGNMQGNRGISSDGQRVYFTTIAPLSFADHNVTADVYEWRRGRDGVALMSSGSSSSPGDWLIGMDAEGGNVFFTSQQRLVADDSDDLYDVYDARVDGGLAPATFDRETSCELDGCQGPPPASPAQTSISSVGFDIGVGPVPDRMRVLVAASELTASPGSAAKLRVRVPGAGRIVVAGPRVRRSSISVPEVGSYSVTVSLTPRAKRSLKKNGRVRVSVRVLFWSKDGQSASKRIKVTFTQPNAKPAGTGKGGR
jgi:hypothetical protein